MPQAAPTEEILVVRRKPTQAKFRARNILFACPHRNAFSIRRLGPSGAPEVNVVNVMNVMNV